MECPELVTSHKFTDNDYDNENLAPIEHRLQQKRGPTTPSTPSVQQKNITRRKFEITKDTSPRGLSYSNVELLHCKYESWALQSELKKSNELVKFLELERKFNS
ncbi:hypothetical protein CAAN1_01S12838 [[Candida] anglica]|uniref:Uncharacterized protein n=1 Tax=[Candida] anglica TaxID=148631 RepID=A0ABP0EKJ0_9ASCO